MEQIGRSFGIPFSLPVQLHLSHYEIKDSIKSLKFFGFLGNEYNGERTINKFNIENTHDTL